MSIHYKFKNTKDYDAIKFDGVYLSVSDLKQHIINQKKFSNSDLQLENEETKELYKDDQMIPKNTNIIVSRLPSANSHKRPRTMTGQHHSNNGNPSGNTNHHNNHHHHHHNNHHHHRQPASTSSLSTMSDQSNGGGREAFELVNTKNMTEEEKLKYIRSQSTKDFDPSRYARGGRGGGYRGRGGAGGRFPVGSNYTCRKCGIPGHSIYDCRMNTMYKVKRSSGIPRDFLMKVDSKEKGALMTPSGEYAVPFIDREAYSNPKVEKAPFFEDGTPPSDAPSATTMPVNSSTARS